MSPQEEVFTDSYRDWLKSVDGGLTPPRSAAQHRGVVVNILHYLDPSGKDYTKLFSRHELNAWVTHYEAKGREPGTIKTNLNSVKKFYDFVLITQPSYVTVHPNTIAQMKGILKQWCRNYYKKIQIPKNKQLNDLAKLPTPSEIKLLDSSNYKQEANKTLSSLSCTETIPSRKGYCLVTDYLLTYLILDNASRAGCISNMTISEFNNAELQADGSFIIAVKKHKTAATAGPAMLSLSDLLMRHLKLFVRRVRNRLTGIKSRKDDPVFASWSGKLMATSMIGTQLNRFWKIAVNIDIERRITSTLIRKMTTTAVHENAGDLRQSVADLMNHDLKTAEKEYFLVQKKKSVAATAARLRDIIRTAFSTPALDTTIDLNKVFAAEIEKKSIKINEVRAKMDEHPELQSWDELKLRDKVMCKSLFSYLLMKPNRFFWEFVASILVENRFYI